MSQVHATIPCIVAAQAGDVAARQALFEASLPAVMRWCARLGGPYVDAEDAAQDVLLRVFDRLDELEKPEAFDAWLFSITRRVLAWHRRRVWWRRWVPGASLERATERDCPEQATSDARLAHHIHHILERLPEPQREVVVLCYIEERSTSEAARLLGISQGTVKSRLRLGRTRFAALARQRGLTEYTSPTAVLREAR